MKLSRRACLLASLAAGLGSAPLAFAATRQIALAVVSLEQDPRYQPRRVEKAYPGHPVSPCIEGVRLAASDSSYELGSSGQALEVRPYSLGRPEELPQLVERLQKDRTRYLVADLPAALLRALVKSLPASSCLVFNASQDDDGLRSEPCTPHLLHTYPSRSMLADALGQFLASRRWTELLVLTGPLPGDEAWRQAWQRAMKRHGLRAVAERPFKLGNDPRDRDLGNPRLLTTIRQSYDAVVVLDSDGEFARLLPYATQLPRPVVGSAGLVALAWHPHWDRHGAPQLSRRFFRQVQRPMQGQDWAAWMAGRCVAALLTQMPKAEIPAQLEALRHGRITLDGFKGKALSFRAWDGQLRQPIFLAHGDGVIATAPFEGFLHPTETLDTLGIDQPESPCRKR